MTPDRLAEIRAVNRSMKFVSAKHVEGVIVELADALEASWAECRLLSETLHALNEDNIRAEARAEQAEAEVSRLCDTLARVRVCLARPYHCVCGEITAALNEEES